jgi:hypothetical protein
MNRQPGKWRSIVSLIAVALFVAIAIFIAGNQEVPLPAKAGSPFQTVRCKKPR